MTSIYFTNPLWLLLAVPVVVLVAYSRSRSLVETSRRRQSVLVATRCVVCLSAILALAGLTLSLSSSERETIFLIDSSASVSEESIANAEEFVSRANVPNVKKIYFGAKTTAGSRSELTDEDKSETNLETAITAALASSDPTRTSHIVLFSDGVETSGKAENALNETRVPISVMPLERSQEKRLQLARLEAPDVARQGAPFTADAIVLSSVETDCVLSVYQNGTLIERRAERVSSGENRFSFACSASVSDKELEISATLESSEEIPYGSDTARAFVALKGKPKILIVAKEVEPLRNFVSALRAQDLEAEARPLEGTPENALDMAPFDAIVLADVPAPSLSTRQMEALGEYVRDFGGGLIAIGGENAFGAGGYGRTPLDSILPVASEYEKDKEKPSLAISLVIDRSGSMEGDKLELTKKAAQGVVELLSAQDYISVIAFDDAPREVVPIQNVASTSAICETIGAISSDGSTNIFPALSKATDDLLRVNAKFKHIILLSDGLSVPGEYEQTIRRAVGGNITVSTVGIGSDADRFLLEKLASEGSGRSYFCDDPRSVPQIFARETRLADRSSVSEEAFLAFEEASSAKLLGDVTIEDAPPLLGYSIVRAKPTSEIALTTETGDPLLAFWRYGLGVSVAFTSDADGRWSAEWLDWEDFAPFWAQITRYAMRQSDGSNAQSSLVVDGSRATLYADVRDRSDRFLNGATVTATLANENGSKEEIAAVQSAPGLYEVSFPIESDAKYAVALTATVDDEPLFTTTRAFSSSKARETDLCAVDEEALRAIASRTGGAYSPAPEDLAEFPAPYRAKKTFPLRSLLLCLAVLTFVADVYLRRID